MYKVVEEEVSEFLLKGSVRIGSAKYYRDTEDEVRADKKEGAKSIEVTNTEENMRLNPEQVNSLLTQSFAPFRSNGIGFKFKGEKGRKTTLESDANILMFCVTQDPSVNKFGSHVLELTDPDRFGLSVSRALVGEVANGNIKLSSLPARVDYRFTPVLYSNKGVISFDSSINFPSFILSDFFTKPLDYSLECEIRFVWFFSSENGNFIPLPTGFKFIDLQIDEVDVFQKKA